MDQALIATFRISLLVFLVGNLGGMGLELAVRDAARPLRDVRFVVQVLAWGFVAGPALAWLLARLLPLDHGHAVGLLLLSMTPCAPFMPMVVRRARGDLAYTAGMTLLTAVGTVLFMPVAVPRMIPGLEADAWTIGRPLLFFVLAPLAVGMLVRAISEAGAAKAAPVVRKLSGLATLVLLISMVAVYREQLVGVVASLAPVAQLVLLGTVTVGTHVLAFGLRPEQASVLSLGNCTRNLGAAFAPLMVLPDADPKAIAMLVLGVPITVLLSVVAALWFARQRPETDAAQP